MDSTDISFHFILLIEVGNYMHELVEISENTATRFVKLKNVYTSIVDECFDDSAVVSERNFGFMQIGQQYECKIKLFGKPSDKRMRGSVVCTVIDKEATIGEKPMVEVRVNDEKYYIAKKKVEEYLSRDYFYFFSTRKDLVQVNDVIHADFEENSQHIS